MKEEDLLIKNILKEQSSVKIVLNKEVYELDDATVPFQVAFDEKIAGKQPTHILVIDVSRNVIEEDVENGMDIRVRESFDSTSDRKVFKLEPVNYFQFSRPGIHHLIFVLFHISSKKEFSQFEKKFFEKETRNSYYQEICFDRIEKNLLKDQCGYCEVVVDVPNEFFAEKPKSGLKLLLWNYVNSWYSTPPVDQCEFRKRSIWAYTIKPSILLIGFILRLLVSLIAFVITSGARIITFIFGVQPVRFIPNKKEFWWEFLFLYETKMDEIMKSNFWWGQRLEREYYYLADDDDFYAYKDVMIGKKLFHTPITVYEIFMYFYAFKFYYLLFETLFQKGLSFGSSFLSLIGLLAVTFIISVFTTSFFLPSIKGTKEWKDKWISDKGLSNKVWLWMIRSCLLPIFMFIIFSVPWLEILSYLSESFRESSTSNGSLFILASIAGIAFLIYFFVKKISPKWLTTAKEKSWGPSESEKNEFIKEGHKEKWLRESFDLKNIADRVDINHMPKPSSKIHVFRIKFWQTKAKVCMPYAK